MQGPFLFLTLLQQLTKRFLLPCRSTPHWWRLASGLRFFPTQVGCRLCLKVNQLSPESRDAEHVGHSP